MKTKKILLPGMLATMAFAACTQEELVSMPGATPEVDLSNRPMVGVVDLNFDPVTRATLAEDKNYASLVWENDTIGARLIDELFETRNQHNPVVSYKGGSNAYTNYAYKKVAGGNVWTTEALLVEGNYMFYAPYNEAARERAAHELTFPVTQVVDTEDEGVENVDANTSAIKGFYQNTDGHVFALGHAFVSADVDDPKVTPTMTHLYAYPQLTLKNGYKEITENGMNDIVTPKAIEVDKIVISSSKLYGKYKVRNDKFIENLTQGYAQLKDNNGKEIARSIAEGQWHKGLEQGIREFRYAATSDILAPVGSNEDVTIDFVPNKILAPGEEFSFHAVLPAAEYGDFEMTVVLAGGKTFYQNGTTNANNVYEADYSSDVNKLEPAATAITYAPMHRYPVQEWNFPVGGNAAVKATAGELATFVVDGYIGEYKAPRKGIKDIGEFAEYLRDVTNNTNSITEGDNTFTLYTYTAQEAAVSTTDDIYEGYAQLELNQELLDTITKYLVDGTVTFTSKMTVKGAFTSNDRIAGVGALKQLDNAKIQLGTLTINGDADFKGETSLAGTTINGNATFDGKIVGYKDANNNDVESSATIAGTAEFNGGTINGSVGGEATFKSGSNIMKATADGASVQSGTLYVKNQLREITVFNDATVELDQENYSGKIKLGKQNANNNDYTDGNLKINNNQSELDVVFGQGDVTVAADKVVKFKNAWTSTKATTITNNGTIKNDLTVAAGNTYTHGQNAAIDGLTNNGTVYNNGKLTLTNNKDVVIGSANFTKTDIAGGTGRIDNSALGYVTGTTANQTIFVKTIAATANDDLWKDWTATQKTNSQVNTIRFEHKWSVNKDYVGATNLPAYHYELASAEGIMLDAATISFYNALSVKILANQKWEGLDKAISKVFDANNKVEFCKDSNGQYYTLEVVDINMNGIYDKAFAKAIAEGGKIKLTENVTYSTGLNIALGKKVEINLNGKTMTGTTAGTGDDITIANGAELKVSGGNVVTGQTAFFNNGGKLELENVNVTGSHQDATVVSANGGTMNITGGKIECTNETESDMYVVGYRNYAKGTINTTVVGKKRGALTVINDAEVTVSGGTYKAGKFYGLYVSSNAEVWYDFATASFQGAEAAKDVCHDVVGGKPTVNGSIVKAQEFKEDTVNEE